MGLYINVIVSMGLEQAKIRLPRRVQPELRLGCAMIENHGGGFKGGWLEIHP
jgi:hypothetical protein